MSPATNIESVALRKSRPNMTPIPPDQKRWNAPGPAGGPNGVPPARSNSRWIALIWVLVGLVGLAVVSSLVSTSSQKSTAVPYSAFLSQVSASEVKSVDINESTGKITGVLTDGKSFSTQGPSGGLPTADVALLDEHQVQRDYASPSTGSSIWTTLLTWGLVIVLMVAFMVWISRRAQGQMAGLSG
jgi:ATP-dependent Zn protease